MTRHQYNFAHLNNGPKMRPEDVPPDLPFRHLAIGAGSNSSSRVEGWEHRTRNGGYLGTAGAPGKEHAR